MIRDVIAEVTIVIHHYDFCFWGELASQVVTTHEPSSLEVLQRADCRCSSVGSTGLGCAVLRTDAGEWRAAERYVAACTDGFTEDSGWVCTAGSTQHYYAGHCTSATVFACGGGVGSDGGCDARAANGAGFGGSMLVLLLWFLPSCCFVVF